MNNETLCELSAVEAAAVVGGAASGVDFNAIRQQAAQYCPTTAAKYANVDPSKVTRAQAQQMGNSCLAEMSPFTRMFAQGPIQDGINKAFPQK
jgi:hypothetical protein